MTDHTRSSGATDRPEFLPPPLPGEHGEPPDQGGRGQGDYGQGDYGQGEHGGSWEPGEAWGRGTDDDPYGREEPGGWGRPDGGPAGDAAGDSPGGWSGASPGGAATGPFGDPPPPRNAYGLGPEWAPPPEPYGGQSPHGRQEPYELGHGPHGAYGGPFGGGGPTGAATVRRGPSGALLTVLAVIIALVAGGAASWGTFLLTRSSSGIDPGYTLPSPRGAATSRPPESVAGVAARVLPSVVSLEVKGNSEAGTGSGFVIKGGYIVTNNHVVAVAARTGEIRIRFNDHTSASARVVGRDPNSDIAVVKPDGPVRAPELPLGNSDSVVVGDPVIAIGSPLGLSGTVTTGIVSSLNRPVEAGGSTGSDYALINAIQTDAAINPGNSGGPLVNASGEVIGVNSAIATVGANSLLGQQSGSIGLGFAIPANQVRRIAQELITTGTARTSRIGVSIDQSYQGQGVRIANQSGSVTAGGPADKAGLRPGDIILEVDGQPVGGSRELIVTIRSKAPGDRVSIKFRHGGEERTAMVTIGAAPAPTAQPS
ncbi:trypsin-like peptidase domain-containing protein [Sphaerimonospora cavernae]|uniref:Trypsin-like peptidase domain-containing protein n=1 Tax=Sphaerimonospora cavernae TaxID=1740611 RepID=A0ABV6UC65_9ACTN